MRDDRSLTEGNPGQLKPQGRPGNSLPFHSIWQHSNPAKLDRSVEQKVDKIYDVFIALAHVSFGNSYNAME